MAAALAFVSHAVGQDPPERRISSVAFTGLARTGEALVRDVVGVTAGDPFDTAVLDEAVTRLLRTGRFIAATYRIAEEDGGVRVTFEVQEPPIITAVRFEGNEKIADRQLKGECGVAVGGRVDRFAIEACREAILALYREAAYENVAVDYDLDEVRRSGELVYAIREGQRVRIRAIGFEGNRSIRDKELRRHIDTKKAFWIFRTGAFDESRVASDVARVQSYYRDQGFLDAKVSYRRQPTDDGQGLTLTFKVDEGARYAIESIEFRGNQVFSREELLDAIGSQIGAIVRRPQIDADVRTIETRYGELGHIYVRVRAIRVFSDTPELVRITFEIEEGEAYRVGRVRVRGNTRTRDKVVRRALNLYPPDDLFDLTEAQEAERRLRETRIFSAARVYPIGDEPGVRDVVIDVQEAEKAGDFIFGLGVTSNSGIVGNVVLDLQNFDLADPPRNWAELWKFRSFFGGGQRLRLELQPGTELSRFRVDFTEPYLFDKPMRFDTSLYLFGRGREGYDEERGGGYIGISKRFERGRWHGWSGELALRVENVTIDDLEIFTSRKIREDEGSHLMTSFKGTLVRDRTDSRFLPTDGDRLRIAYEQFGALGGDHVFGKLSGGYTWYKTVHQDLLDRKSVLELRLEGAVILGNAPVFERFFGGGTGSIRGFEFRGVGPRHGIDENNIGGDYLVLAGGEYSFPLFGESVRGLFFVDSGMVGSGPVRAAIGTGVRFTIQFFGPVPLELNLAFPVLSDEDDEEQVFSFQIGGLF